MFTESLIPSHEILYNKHSIELGIHCTVKKTHRTTQEQEVNFSNHFLHHPEAATLTEERALP